MDTLRADAVRNRQLFLDAARSVFGERGLAAPMDEIARRAGLGNATLYRHFPTRCSLVGAVFVETLRDVVEATELALAEPDPWTGFSRQVRTLCRLQASNRALADLLTATIGGAPELENLRSRAYAGTVTLIKRAQRSGQLRWEFRHEDLVLLLMANAGLIERTETSAPGAWQRHLDYLLDGLRPAAGPVTASPGEAAVRAAMDLTAQRFGTAEARQRHGE
jgi:AcrR family transcriptional regulator